MTQEQKAKELMGCPCIFKIKDCEACINMLNLLEMAAWEEQQMIKKACDAYCETCSHRPAKDSFISKFCEQNDCMYIYEFKKYLK